MMIVEYVFPPINSIFSVDVKFFFHERVVLLHVWNKRLKIIPLLKS